MVELSQNELMDVNGGFDVKGAFLKKGIEIALKLTAEKLNETPYTREVTRQGEKTTINYDGNGNFTLGKNK